MFWKIKRGRASVLLAAVLVCATGCGSDDTDDTGGTEGASTDALTITWESGSEDAMTAVVAAFAKEHPDIKVDVTYLAPDAITSQIPTRLSAGTGPDLFRADAGQGTAVSVIGLAKRGLLAPLTGDWADDVPESISQVIQYDGKQYGFSISLTNVAQLLNDDLLDKYGLTPPTTFDEVLQFCADARSAGTVAYAAGPATPFESRSVIYALSFQEVYAEHPDFDAALADGSLTWADSGWADAIDKNLQMVDAGCFPDNFTGVDLPGAFSALFGQQTLGIVGYGAYLPYGPPELSFSSYPLPGSDDPDESGMIVAPFQSMVLNAAAKNPENAQTFVDFLAQPEIGQLYVDNASANGGLVPTFYDGSTPLTHQVDQQIVDFLNSGKSNTFPDATLPDAQVTSALESSMQEALAGDATAADVIAAVQAAYDKAVG